ncbi:MAG: hypothetical protein KA126_03410 [Candidatus Hydrothermae bacterium]|nr:hypothetical protein [Candidatus Hydrothermae bacterium]
MLIFLVSHVNAGRVLFDNTKNETAGNADWVIDHNYPYPQPVNPSGPTDWDGAISSWGYALYLLGYEVITLLPSYGITYGNSSNPLDLSNFDVFVMVEPQNVLADDEVAAILGFMANGGGFFMVADHNSSDRDGDGWDSPRVFNHAFESYLGVHFNVTGERPNSFSGASTNVLHDEGNSIYNGSFGMVQSLGFWSGTCATLDTSINYSASGLVWVPGAEQDCDSIMFFYGYYGNGRFAGLGDSSPCDDGTGDLQDNLYDNWSMYSDSVIILNATLWLMGGEAAIPESVHEGKEAKIITLSAADLMLRGGIKFYDLAGREVLKIVPGLYFVRDIDGLFSKVVVE